MYARRPKDEFSGSLKPRKHAKWKVLASYRLPIHNTAKVAQTVAFSLQFPAFRIMARYDVHWSATSSGYLRGSTT